MQTLPHLPRTSSSSSSRDSELEESSSTGQLIIAAFSGTDIAVIACGRRC